MDDDRRIALFDDAITRSFSASSLEVLIGIIFSWAAAAGVVALLTWWLSKPLSEAPVAYAIVFATAAMTFAFTVAAAFIGQQLGDLARVMRAVALSRPLR